MEIFTDEQALIICDAGEELVNEGAISARVGAFLIREFTNLALEKHGMSVVTNDEGVMVLTIKTGEQYLANDGPELQEILDAL